MEKKTKKEKKERKFKKKEEEGGGKEGRLELRGRKERLKKEKTKE